MLKDLFKKYQELDGVIGDIGLYAQPIRTLANEIGEQHFTCVDSDSIIYTFETAKHLHTAQAILLFNLVETVTKLSKMYNSLFDEFSGEVVGKHNNEP